MKLRTKKRPLIDSLCALCFFLSFFLSLSLFLTFFLSFILSVLFWWSSMNKYVGKKEKKKKRSCISQSRDLSPMEEKRRAYHSFFTDFSDQRGFEDLRLCRPLSSIEVNLFNVFVSSYLIVSYLTSSYLILRYLYYFFKKLDMDQWTDRQTGQLTHHRPTNQWKDRQSLLDPPRLGVDKKLNSFKTRGPFIAQ